MHKSKYWGRNSQPLHEVTHRAIGDIPGCTPAPREGTFVNTSHEEAKRITLARAQWWCEAIQKYVDGEYGGTEGLKEAWSQASRAPAMFGAYGEKL